LILPLLQKVLKMRGECREGRRKLLQKVSSPPLCSYPSSSNVKSEKDYVAVLHYVFLTLGAN